MVMTFYAPTNREKLSEDSYRFILGQHTFVKLTGR